MFIYYISIGNLQMRKISGVYKITNNITGDFYIGSSRNIKQRWYDHKSPSRWKQCQNSPLYLDFQKYGLENFKFEIVEETTNLHEREQYFIDLLKPSYNNYRANGLDVERWKKYQQTEEYKEIIKKSNKKWGDRLCLYNGKTLTLSALNSRFQRQGIPHSALEAKKYLLKK